MVKRYKTRALKKHHSYTVEEVAETIGAHPQTVRAWTEKGLPCLKDKTPFLILGAHLQDFLATRDVARRQPLEPDQLYCLRCKAAKTPAGTMADYVPQGAGRGRLTGICPDCECLCHRFVRADRLAEVAPNLAVMRQNCQPSLKEPDKAA